MDFVYFPALAQTKTVRFQKIVKMIVITIGKIKSNMLDSDVTQINFTYHCEIPLPDKDFKKISQFNFEIVPSVPKQKETAL